MGWQQSTENTIQTDLDCRPCSIFGQKACRRGDYACMNSIRPTTIVEKINTFIK
jgi:ADP-heptose:LPS heptosyltransferase